jgi:mRNA-degrading endonuclease RelE of RelBE toxin-antitoxin system
MHVEFRNSFLKDIKRLKDRKEKELVKKVIEECEAAESSRQILHCEPLTSKGKFFKIKYGQYRFGVYINKGTIEFLKFGTRQSFYKDFPPY